MQHARACRAPGFHGNAAHRWQQALRVVCLFLPQAGTLVVAVHHVVQAGAACTPSACFEWQLVDAIAVAGIAHQNSRSAGRPVALRHGHTLTNMVVLFQMKLRLVELPRAMWLAACTRVAHAIKVFVGGICSELWSWSVCTCVVLPLWYSCQQCSVASGLPLWSAGFPVIAIQAAFEQAVGVYSSEWPSCLSVRTSRQVYSLAAVHGSPETSCQAVPVLRSA